MVEAIITVLWVIVWLSFGAAIHPIWRMHVLSRRVNRLKREIDAELVAWVKNEKGNG